MIIVNLESFVYSSRSSFFFYATMTWCFWISWLSYRAKVMHINLTSLLSQISAYIWSKLRRGKFIDTHRSSNPLLFFYFKTGCKKPVYFLWLLVTLCNRFVLSSVLTNFALLLVTNSDVLGCMTCTVDFLCYISCSNFWELDYCCKIARSCGKRQNPQNRSVIR